MFLSKPTGALYQNCYQICIAVHTATQTDMALTLVLLQPDFEDSPGI